MHQTAMVELKLVSGLAVLAMAAVASSAPNLQSGVDLVTNLSNSIVPVLVRSLKGENVVVGPYGLLSNVAIALEASNGKTREELLKSLKLTEDRIEDLRTGFKAYCQLFLDHETDQEAAGSFNSAVVNVGFPLSESFREMAANNYCANITSTDASGNAALELRSDAGVVTHWKDYEKLAVYTFLSHKSVTPFAREDNVAVPVPMIPQVGVFKSLRSDEAQIILLPLQAKFVHLLIAVPDRAERLDAMAAKIVNRNLANLVEGMPSEEMEVFLPQLTAVSKGLNFSRVLVRSGVRELFDATKANLTNAGNVTGTYVRSITQDAFFSTSFVSLKSVSGTSTSFGGRRGKRDTTRRFHVDRPFLFFILHKQTQLVLVAGKIGNPVQVPS